MQRFFFLYTLLYILLPFPALSQPEPANPRLIVLTDISSLSNEKGEPDDSQSLIRLLLYGNELDLEGLIATSNLGHGQLIRPELIRNVIEAYGQVRPNLLLHDDNFPSVSHLNAIVKEGQPVAGPKVPLEQSIGKGKDTEGSDWIIEVVDKEDPRPVWVAIWGGSADLAQALWKVNATRTPDQMRKFVAKLRVHAVYDQDLTGHWIKGEFPELFYILRHHGIRGMYRGGDTTLVRSEWVETNIRNNHGQLGNIYVNYHGGDVWSGKMGLVKGIKEGDTPSFLYLLNNGLNTPQYPDWGNWGGRFKKDNPNNNLWVEAIDQIGNYKADMDPRMASLYRWREAWQADFEARLDWCVKSFKEANHAPRIDLISSKIGVSSGKEVQIPAPKVWDPDGDEVSYNWYFYPEVGSFQGEIPKIKKSKIKVEFTAPQVTQAETLHLILEVTDLGQPSLTAYQRHIIVVNP